MFYENSVYTLANNSMEVGTMKLGYRLDEKGKEVIGTSKIKTKIRKMDVELFVNVNRDVSYPLNSPHNQGLHVKVCGKSEAFFTELNVLDVVNEQQLIDYINEFFNRQGDFVMITKALKGETFSYDTPVYDRMAITNQSYANWDDDLEDLEDNADDVVAVFLNDNLRWEVA